MVVNIAPEKKELFCLYFPQSTFTFFVCILIKSSDVRLCVCVKGCTYHEFFCQLVSFLATIYFSIKAAALLF